MHSEAMSFLRNVLPSLKKVRSVCEFGSRDINGGARSLLPVPLYVGIDTVAGPGVDLVTDAADWSPADGRYFDMVVCTEVLEHTPRGGELVANARKILRLGGYLVVTCAGPERLPHSAIDGGPLRDGEYYRPVTADDLSLWSSGFSVVLTQSRDGIDIYSLCIK